MEISLPSGQIGQSTVDPKRPKSGTTQGNRGKVTQRDVSTVDDDLSTVVSQGDRIESLIVIRDKLARELAHTSGKDCAPLAMRLTAVIEQLEALSVKAEESKIDKLRDDLAAKRADRERRSADSA